MKRKSLLFLLLFALLAPWAANAQSLSDYTVTTSTQTYTSIASADLLLSTVNGDGGTQTVTLPFDFPFGENSYTAGTTLTVRADGYIYFGSSNPGHSSKNAWTNTSSEYYLIAPFLNYDGKITANGATSGAYCTTDDPDNPTVLIIEFKGLQCYYGDNGDYNFQIRLYPNGNISTVYGESTLCTYSYASQNFFLNAKADKVCLTGSYAEPVAGKPSDLPNFTVAPVAGQVITYVRPVFTCPKPALNPEVATTNTTATVSWTPSGDNQQLFDLYWSTSSTAPTAATTPSVANYEGNSYVFNFADLNPSSTYYVWVRGNCGTATNPDVSGGWTTSSASFETPCETITDLPWTVDFEDMTANTVPQCWDNSASTSSTLSGNPERIWGVYSYSSSNKVLRMYNYFVQSGTALINTPSITLPANSEYMLYFDYAHDASCGAFKVKISEDGGTTFVEKGSYTNNSGTFTAATPIDLSSYAGKTIIVQFFANANYGSGAIYVDNVRVDLPTPTITEVVSASPLSTTVTWTGTSSVTGYVYQYKLQDATEWGQEHAVGNSVLSADITTVADGQYDFRLKAQYGTNYSSWVTTQFTAPGYCMVPSGLVISNITWNSAQLTWTEEFGNGEWTLLYKPAGEEGYTNYGTVTTADMPVTLGSLIADTTYNVKIYPTCDEAKILTDQFTTKCEPIDITAAPYNNTWSEDFTDYNTGTFSDNCWENKHIAGDGTYVFNIDGSWSGYTKVMRLPDMSIGTLTKLMLPAITLPNNNYQFVIDVYRSNSTYAPERNPYEGIRVFASANGEIEDATELAFIPRQYNEVNGNIPAETAVGWYTYELPIPMSGLCYIILRGESQYCTATYMDNFLVEPVPTCHWPRNFAYTPASLTNHSVTLTWIPGSEDQSEWQIVYNNRNFDPNVAGFEPNPDSTITVTDTCYTFNKTLQPSTTYYAYVRANCGDGDLSKWSKVVKFTTKAAAPAPTNFQKTDVGPDFATLTWKAGGGDYEANYDLYVVQSATTPATPTIDTVPTIAGITELPTAENPYLLDGLDNEKRYYAWVRANHVHPDTTMHSAWVAISGSYFTTLVACPTPTTKPVTNLQPYSATLNWTGYSESYNVRYREVPQAVGDTVFSESFDGGSIPSGWTNQSGWTVQSSYVKHTSSSGGGSYYLIMPAMDFSTYSSLALSFNYKTPYYSSSYPDDIDGFGVYYRVNGGEWNELFYEVALHNDWTEKTLPLTGLAANYEIGFRMVNNWGGGVFIDEIVVLSLPEAPWISANNGEPIEVTSVDIAELADSTRYEWQVQATCANDWTASAYFTTPWACTAPVADSATNITYNSADLYWTGYQDEYNVRYRTAETVDIFLQTGYLATNYNWSGWTSNSPGGSNESGLYYLDEDHTMVGWVFVYNESVTPQYRISREMTPVVSGTTLQFYAGLYGDTDEVLTVGFSSTDNAVASFTWNEEPVALTTAGGYFTMAVPEGTKYIAFQHVSGEDALYLFDVTVYANYVPAGEWEYANNVTSPTTIDELLDETWYEWQVQGLGECTEGTGWSTSDYFQTKKAYIQTVELTEGWNWFSTYIDVEDNNIFDQLKAGLGTSGLQIASQGNGASTYKNGRWLGTVTIKNESGYKIKTSAAVTFTIVGSQYADPAECPITIRPSWNWIGYPVSEPQTVTTAMAGFNAANNDQIKTLGGGATYRGRWMSPTYTLVPGKSYAYKSNASEIKTLFFPNVESTAKSEPTKAAPNKLVKPFRAMNEAPLLKKGFLGKPIEKQ